MARLGLVAATVASIMLGYSMPVLSQAKDFDSLVTVSMYTPNPDYLKFAVHRQLIKQLSVITQLVCRVEMDAKGSGQKRIVVALTELPPHFFEFDKDDLLLYRPHGLNQPQVTSWTCLGGADFPEGDLASGIGDLQTNESSKGIGGSSEKNRVHLKTNKDGSPTSLEALIKGSSAPSAEDKEFLEDLQSLGPNGLHQPETKAILNALRTHSSHSEEHNGSTGPEDTVAPGGKLIGPAPPLATIPLGAPPSEIMGGVVPVSGTSSVGISPHLSVEASPSAVPVKAEKSPTGAEPSPVAAQSQQEIATQTKATDKAAKQRAKEDAKAAKAKAKAEQDSNPDEPKPEHVHHDHKKKDDPK